MRHLDITVRHVDDYLGMIKYGYGGAGLVDGLRTQVTFLVQALRDLEVIDLLEICLQCELSEAKEETQKVLKPFHALRNVRAVRTSGHVLEHTAAELKLQLPQARRLAEDPNSEVAGQKSERQARLQRPPNLESNVKKGLAVYRGYEGRDI